MLLFEVEHFEFGRCDVLLVKRTTIVVVANGSEREGREPQTPIRPYLIKQREPYP